MSKKAKQYLLLVQTGTRAIEDVPEPWRTEVLEELAKSENANK